MVNRIKNGKKVGRYLVDLLAFLGIVLRFVVAVEEFAIEELDAHHGKDQEE